MTGPMVSPLGSAAQVSNPVHDDAPPLPALNTLLSPATVIKLASSWIRPALGAQVSATRSAATFGGGHRVIERGAQGGERRPRRAGSAARHAGAGRLISELRPARRLFGARGRRQRARRTAPELSDHPRENRCQAPPTRRSCGVKARL